MTGDRDDELRSAAVIDALYREPVADQIARSSEQAALDRVRALYRELPAEDAPPAALAKILALAAAQAPRPAVTPNRLLAWLRPRLDQLAVSPALAAASLLLVVVGGVLITRGDVEVPQPPVSRAEEATASATSPAAGSSPSGSVLAGRGEVAGPSEGTADELGDGSMELADKAGASEGRRAPPEDDPGAAKKERRKAARPPAPAPGGRRSAPTADRSLPLAADSDAVDPSEEREVAAEEPRQATDSPARSPVPPARSAVAGTAGGGRAAGAAPAPSPAPEVARLHALAVELARKGDCAGARAAVARLRKLEPSDADRVSRDTRLAPCLTRR